MANKKGWVIILDKSESKITRWTERGGYYTKAYTSNRKPELRQLGLFLESISRSTLYTAQEKSDAAALKARVVDLLTTGTADPTEYEAVVDLGQIWLNGEVP